MATEQILITIDDVRELVQISEQFNLDNFNGRVLQVQRINLRDLLGKALYYDFFNNITDTKYTDLINGSVYIDGNNDTVNYFGLKPFLVYHVVASIMNDNSVKLSDIGNISVNGENFSPSNANLVKKAQDAYLRNSVTAGNDIIDFLNENTTIYPLWDSTCEEANVNVFSLGNII